MSKIHVMEHPLIQHKISYIRREDVGTKEFREVIGEIAGLMCYEATRDLKLADVKIKTPITETWGKELTGKKLAVVPILRLSLIHILDGVRPNQHVSKYNEFDSHSVFLFSYDHILMN